MVYEFELNMDESYADIENIDEWGSAFLQGENGGGVEYNFCKDSNDDCSAIYYFEQDEEYLSTNYDEDVHYEIDFNNENWEQELIDAMVKALECFEKKEV